MFPTFGFGEQVLHHRYQGKKKDADGYRTSGYTDPVTVENVGVDITVTSEQANTGTAQVTQTDAVLFLPAGYEADSRDRFTVRGRLYEAVGHGIPLKNFLTGDTYCTEIPVRRVYGQEEPQVQ